MCGATPGPYINADDYVGRYKFSQVKSKGGGEIPYDVPPDKKVKRTRCPTHRRCCSWVQLDVNVINCSYNYMHVLQLQSHLVVSQLQLQLLAFNYNSNA